MLTLILLLLAPSSMAQTDPLDTLLEALWADDVESVVSQIESGASPDSGTKAETLLTYSIKRNSIEMVSALLDHGANPNLAQPVTQFSPLMVAAKHKNAPATELLIAKGANVNASGVFGRNPLHIAALFNSLEVAHILLSKTNVDVNSRGKLCPLAVASRQGYLEFVNMILRESKVSPAEKCLLSAKDMAALNQHDDVLAVLNSL
jgi:ankyrin repeat protein